jgi:lysophospholipase L1-like esterase
MRQLPIFTNLGDIVSLKYKFKWLTVLCLFSLLAACGGGGGGSSSDTNTPIDPSTNTSPVADAGTDQLINASQSVQLDGSGSSDSDGTISQYSWTQTSGTTVSINGSNTQTPVFTAPDASVRETLTFQLSVTDDDGATSSDSVSITINIAPTVDAGLDQEVQDGDAVDLSATGNDTDGTVAGYAWEQVAGTTTVTLSNADTSTPSFTAPATTQSLTFQVTVTDNDGHQSTDEVQVHVAQELYSDAFGSTDLSNWVEVNDVTGSSMTWEIVNDELFQQDLNESVQAFDFSYHLGTFLYLNVSGSGNWDNYTFSVEATPLTNSTDPQGNDTGILFRYNASDDSYYRLSMNSRYGFTRLEKKVNGVFSTLAVDARGYTDDTTHFLKVEVSGSLIHVYIDDEAVFSVTDDDLATGTIALYAQDKSKFDNVIVSECSPAPSIVTENPIAYGISTIDGQSTLNLSATVTDMPAGASVEFVLDSTETVESSSTGNPYTAVFTSVASGNHDVTALIRDAEGVELARDLNENVGVQGKYYITVGNSLTNGVDDEVASNNVSADGRIVAIQGYQARLNNLLTDYFGIPHIVFNEGIGGDESSDTQSRLSSILDRHPDTADAVLVLIGTNDSFNVTPDTFETNVSNIANAIVAAGKSCWLAEIPPVYNEDGTENTSRNDNITQYNTRIQAIANQSSSDQIFLGPDFYDAFEDTFDTYYSSDGIHMNDAGYQQMAQLWYDVIR